jgi:hypothetical protein
MRSISITCFVSVSVRHN